MSTNVVYADASGVRFVNTFEKKHGKWESIWKNVIPGIPLSAIRIVIACCKLVIYLTQAFF
jgi:hypothetical protein